MTCTSPATRESRIEAAWATLVDLASDDTTLRTACETLLADCRDPRRNTAADILALIGDDR